MVNNMYGMPSGAGLFPQESHNSGYVGLFPGYIGLFSRYIVLQRVAACCSVLQRVAELHSEGAFLLNVCYMKEC